MGTKNGNEVGNGTENENVAVNGNGTENGNVAVNGNAAVNGNGAENRSGAETDNRKEKAVREDIINHTEESRYVAPQEPEVLRKLEWFQDQKLAFMVHWGTYSQLGICESWPLSDGDKDWARREYTWLEDPEEFRNSYFSLNRTFNPIRFDENVWADFAAEAGFRYLIFTTKHHDGFCMYDSKYSSYKITGEDCPFHTSKNPDVTRRLFDAFRRKGLGIAAYFSKPDWHCPWYWAKGCEKPIAADRNPTYDPVKRPDLWQKYTEYTQNQMMELVQDYGPLDILWLDGGQVNPVNHQDIHMDVLAKKARQIKPDLLIADRTVGGPYENYITPEQTIPDHVLHVPWESCVTIGNSFSFRYEDDYKSPRTLVRLLIQVVTRGGNLALNLGAQPDGRLPRHGMEAALGLGRWLKKNQEAIYGTRAVESGTPSGDFGFTVQRKDAKAAALTAEDRVVYALKPYAEEESKSIEEFVMIPWDKKVSKLELVETGEELPFTRVGSVLQARLPFAWRAEHPLALNIRMTP